MLRTSRHLRGLVRLPMLRHRHTCRPREVRGQLLPVCPPQAYLRPNSHANLRCPGATQRQRPTTIFTPQTITWDGTPRVGRNPMTVHHDCRQDLRRGGPISRILPPRAAVTTGGGGRGPGGRRPGVSERAWCAGGVPSTVCGRSYRRWYNSKSGSLSQQDRPTLLSVRRMCVHRMEHGLSRVDAGRRRFSPLLPIWDAANVVGVQLGMRVAVLRGAMAWWLERARSSGSRRGHR